MNTKENWVNNGVSITKSMGVYITKDSGIFDITV